MNFVLFLTLLLNFCFDHISSQSLPSGCQTSFRNAALIAHNNLRARHGSPVLKVNANIDASALKWSNYLAANDVFQHSGPGENLYMVYGVSISSSSQCASKKKLLIIKYIFLF